MKPGLAAIQEFVQQVVEAIAAAIGVEVMVFDLDRDIVAGTGETRVEVGHRYNEGSLTGRLLSSGQPYIARSPGQSQECLPCSKYGSCPHYMVVAFPIRVEGEILGSFCLVAIDEQQRQRVLANEENLLRFLDRMCLLIGSAISERKAREEMGLLLKRYNNVVNTVHEGILATGQTGRITHFNSSAAGLLGIRADQALGRQLKEIFPDLAAVKNFKKGTLEMEVCCRNKGRKRYFLATVVPVLDEAGENVQGLTVSLRNLSEIQSYATKLLGEFSNYSFQDILGESRGVLQVKEKLSRAALTDSTILIRGESGTGKELFAHAVHAASHRSGGPFVAINCSAIPESLLESELFGYEEGAFTGAKKGGKPGKFELAGGGTLFLDEIGDMPLHLQSKLLRVLENHSIERVGGTETTPINVRIIAATNRNLEEMVERYEFRGDLYYRLSVIPVFIPSLRDRKEDLPVLINHFLNKYCAKLGRSRQKLDPGAEGMLVRYGWPGNVRELQNAIEYAINMSEPGQLITVDHLPQRIFDQPQARPGNGGRPPQPPSAWTGTGQAGSPAKGDQGAAGGGEGGLPESTENNLKVMETEAIREALKRFGTTTAGKEKAARHLGISLATLYRRLKEKGGGR